jgi:hypothetical protein
MVPPLISVLTRALFAFYFRLAPLPKGKRDATKKSLDEARAFLAKGI